VYYVEIFGKNVTFATYSELTYLLKQSSFEFCAWYKFSAYGGRQVLGL